MSTEDESIFEVTAVEHLGDGRHFARLRTTWPPDPHVVGVPMRLGFDGDRFEVLAVTIGVERVAQTGYAPDQPLRPTLMWDGMEIGVHFRTRDGANADDFHGRVFVRQPTDEERAQGAVRSDADSMRYVLEPLSSLTRRVTALEKRCARLDMHLASPGTLDAHRAGGARLMSACGRPMRLSDDNQTTDPRKVTCEACAEAAALGIIDAPLFDIRRSLAPGHSVVGYVSPFAFVAERMTVDHDALGGQIVGIRIDGEPILATTAPISLAIFAHGSVVPVFRAVRGVCMEVELVNPTEKPIIFSAEVFGQLVSVAEGPAPREDDR